MPGNWTHYYFARDVAQDYDLEFKDSKEFYLGALGPEFLSHLPDQAGEDIFTLLREDHTEEMLCLVFDHLAQEDLSAYLHGFLAHYALDSQSGFLINSLQNEGYDKLSVKMALDEAMLRRRYGRIMSKPNLYPLINAGRDVPEKIISFYIKAARKIYGVELDIEEVNQTYRKYLRLIKQASRGLSLFKIGGSWYDLPPEQLLPKEVAEELFLEFLPSYEEARLFYKELLDQDIPCCDRNFSGHYL